MVGVTSDMSSGMTSDMSSGMTSDSYVQYVILTKIRCSYLNLIQSHQKHFLKFRIPRLPVAFFFHKMMMDSWL